MPSYRVVGVMSGSSLDGLDVALCILTLQRGKWSYRIEEARTIPYPAILRERLLTVMSGSAWELAQLDAELGRFIGNACKRYSGRAELIASHGHTIFHQPDKGFTTQVGSGAMVATTSAITTVCDIRSTDVALGGQGAPLVPLGEQLLFPEYNAFVNIGGICNVSLHGPKGIVGYDVCIGNQALNFLANEMGEAYDAKGALARSGSVHEPLLAALNALPFHRQKPPRSLGREWFDAEVRPLIANKRIPLHDRLRTVVEHIAQQLAKALLKANGPVLVTGGGAHNRFLMERLRKLAHTPIEVPDQRTVDYKEALVFALLGVLRMRGEVNALACVTGAKRDSVGGAVHHPN
ncbi:MAG: anhydro-N-acetylmuramic acid kinase [Flavobacteriales bacterium]|nr:anhydro-N-acetylmuramic acid kinase [Flavobacteriales bacterium]